MTGILGGGVDQKVLLVSQNNSLPTDGASLRRCPGMMANPYKSHADLGVTRRDPGIFQHLIDDRLIY